MCRQVALFFSRPKHAIISDRFTSAEVQTSGSAAPVGLSLPTPKLAGHLAPDTLGPLPAAATAAAAAAAATASAAASASASATPQLSLSAIEPDAAGAAAAMGMFGKLARTVVKWQVRPQQP